jgi:hypothetical protein
MLILAFILASPYLLRYGEWRRRVRERKAMFARASRRAKELGRKLVVIGDPDGGVTHGGYGYGDVCIDLATGCAKAPSSTLSLKADISEPLPLESDQYVVFISYVLELVLEIDKAWAEINRIAGSEENIFMLALHPSESATYSYPGIVNAITSMPPDGPLVYAPLSRPAFFSRRL